jgi:hypothetical protein
MVMMIWDDDVDFALRSVWPPIPSFDLCFHFMSGHKASDFMSISGLDDRIT